MSKKEILNFQIFSIIFVSIVGTLLHLKTNKFRLLLLIGYRLAIAIILLHI